MTAILNLVISIYNSLLRLYPNAFRSEFSEQMLLDFMDMAADAGKKGKLSLILFCLRELVDFPGNLLHAHLANAGTLRILRSQPVNSGLRGATGYGAGFAFTTTAAWLVSGLVYSLFDLFMQSLPERIQVAFQSGFLAFTPLGMYFILTSTVFGLLFAVFLGNRTKFYRYVLVGALCWVIPESVSYVLVGSLAEAYYHNENLTPILGYSMCILIGVFLSAAHLIAESDRRKPLGYLAAGIVVYPLGTYLFIKLLFYVWHEITPWFSLSLLVFMVTLIGCVIAATMPVKRNLYFVVAVGGIGYLLLNRVLFYIAYRIPHFSLALDIGVVPDVFAMPVYYMTIYKAVFGSLFGLIVGLMLGLHKKAVPYQSIASV